MSTVVSELILSQVPAASPFVPGTTIQYAWDSTSLTTMLACPQRYKYGIIDGWTPKSPGVAIALSFGILIHYGIEQFHRERSAGQEYDDAVERCLWHVMQKPEYQQLPVHDDIEAAKEEQEEDDDGVGLRNAKVRTRYHLIRALVWYFEQYRNDALKTVQLASGAPAVEYSFRVPVGRHLSDGTEILLSGHFDRLVTFNDEPYVKDTKTCKGISRQYQEDFKLSHQMTGYTLGGRIACEQPVKGVFIDAIALQIGGVKFARFPTYRSSNQLAEYIDLLQDVGEMAERYAMSGRYPKNDKACFFCEFRLVCSTDPALRMGKLNFFYERRPPWNPLANR